MRAEILAGKVALHETMRRGTDQQCIGGGEALDASSEIRRFPQG
jgi:hypothetical protein